jgi:hypothetical protein
MIALLLTTNFGKNNPILAFFVGGFLDIFLGFLLSRILLGLM